uniref:hypothetical protein n=1 Tax=Methylobacterium nigriterrae TaxID=3127512 RepID=UPI003013886D
AAGATSAASERDRQPTPSTTPTGIRQQCPVVFQTPRHCALIPKLVPGAVIVFRGMELRDRDSVASSELSRRLSAMSLQREREGDDPVAYVVDLTCIADIDEDRSAMAAAKLENCNE